MATQKQIDANRRNARKSTGPVSDAGKKISRRNALKHGLAGSGLVLPHVDAEAVRERMAEWHSSLKPFDPYEVWLLEVVAVESIRIDRCRVQDRVLRDEQIHQAHEFWDDHQQQKADHLAGKLGKDPSIVFKLRGTIPGASLVLEHWQALLRALNQGDWTSEQESLAHDLLGIPIALREGASSPFFVDIHGDTLSRRKAIVESEIAKMQHMIREVLPAREANERDLLKAGLPDLDDREFRLLQRYESRCFRRLMWATTQMQTSKHRTVTNGSNRSSDPYDYKPLREAKLPPEPPPKVEEPVYRRPLLKDAINPVAYEIMAKVMRDHERAKSDAKATNTSGDVANRAGS